MKRGKRYEKVASLVEAGKDYAIDDAIELVRKAATAKFDESIEVVVNLGVDPRHADQVVRSTVSLPNGTGKEVRVLVLTKGDKEAEAEKAGADYVGFDDYIKKIEGGWLEFDVMVATPDVMGVVGKLGRVLGPRGLMPNPKSGTVTQDVTKAVTELKAGKIEFRVDKYGILHVSIGRASFEAKALRENLLVFLETVIRLKPSASKGQYLKGVVMSSTMGPGVRLDRGAVLSEVK